MYKSQGEAQHNTAVSSRKLRPPGTHRLNDQGNCLEARSDIVGEGGGGGEGELLLVLRFSVSRPCGTPCGWEESDAVDCGAGVDDYESRAVVELDLQFLGVRLTGPTDGGNEDGVGWAAAGGGAWTGWMSETEGERICDNICEYLIYLCRHSPWAGCNVLAAL